MARRRKYTPENMYRKKVGSRWVDCPKNHYTDGGKNFKKDPPCGKKEIFDSITDDIGKFINDIKKNNTPKARANMLRTDRLRYFFCKQVSDRRDVWDKITDPWWAVSYCKWVRCRPEVYDIIPNDSRPRRYLDNWLKKNGIEPTWLKKRHIAALAAKKAAKSHTEKGVSNVRRYEC